MVVRLSSRFDIGVLPHLEHIGLIKHFAALVELTLGDGVVAHGRGSSMATGVVETERLF